MSFDAPWALGLLGVVALVAGVAASQMRRRGALLARLGAAERLAMLSTLDVRRRWLRFGLWLMAAVFCVVALARPVWGVDAELVEARGVAVVFVLDISNSMDAEDVQPSRLERAKQSILDIVSGLDERVLVGLVLFAGDAFVQLPLTDDTDVLRAFVGAANTEMVTRQGTAIARGLSLAADVLDERVAGEALVVLMTDGENHDLDPTEAAKLLRERGAVLHVLGYGTPDGDVIPIYDADGVLTGVKADDAGVVVVSKLAEPFLQALAEAVDGVYQRAEDSGIEAVAVIEAAQALELGALGARLRTVSVPRFGVFLALAAGCLAAAMLMGERRA